MNTNVTKAKANPGAVPPDASWDLVRRCAHDVRNDLASIHGFVEILLSDSQTLRDPAKVKEFLEHIQTATDHAVLQVNHLRNLGAAVALKATASAARCSDR